VNCNKKEDQILKARLFITNTNNFSMKTSIKLSFDKNSNFQPQIIIAPNNVDFSKFTREESSNIASLGIELNGEDIFLSNFDQEIAIDLAPKERMCTNILLGIGHSFISPMNFKISITQNDVPPDTSQVREEIDAVNTEINSIQTSILEEKAKLAATTNNEILVPIKTTMTTDDVTPTPSATTSAETKTETGTDLTIKDNTINNGTVTIDNNAETATTVVAKPTGTNDTVNNSTTTNEISTTTETVSTAGNIQSSDTPITTETTAVSETVSPIETPTANNSVQK
jgi:hypothetical protein